MHQDVVANGNLTSTRGMAEGTAALGNVTAGTCCRRRPWWWNFVFIVVILIPIIWWLRRHA